MKVLLGDLVNIKTGKLDANQADENGKYPFFTCSKEIIKINSYSYDCECVLIAGNGDLNVKYYNGKFEAYQRTYILTSTDVNTLSNKYIYWFMNRYIVQLRNQSIGGVIKYIKLGDLTNISLNLPTLDVQKRIVGIFESIDRLIGTKVFILQGLDDLIKSRFVELFGDINHNTKNWPIMRLEDLAELITDGEHLTPKRCNDGIYLLSARNVLNHSLKLDDVDYIDETEYNRISKRVVPKAGDILLSCSGSVGRCCRTPMEIKFQLVRSVALIRFKSEITPIFAEYMITSDWFQRQINSLKTASSQANLFQGKIKKLKGFVPDMNLQYNFIQFVNQINKLKSDVQKSIDETRLLMDSLMQEYFG